MVYSIRQVVRLRLKKLCSEAVRASRASPNYAGLKSKVGANNCKYNSQLNRRKKKIYSLSKKVLSGS